MILFLVIFERSLWLFSRLVFEWLMAFESRGNICFVSRTAAPRLPTQTYTPDGACWTVYSRGNRTTSSPSTISRKMKITADRNESFKTKNTIFENHFLSFEHCLEIKVVNIFCWLNGLFGIRCTADNKSRRVVTRRIRCPRQSSWTLGEVGKIYIPYELSILVTLAAQNSSLFFPSNNDCEITDNNGSIDLKQRKNKTSLGIVIKGLRYFEKMVKIPGVREQPGAAVASSDPDPWMPGAAATAAPPLPPSFWRRLGVSEWERERDEVQRREKGRKETRESGCSGGLRGVWERGIKARSRSTGEHTSLRNSCENKKHQHQGRKLRLGNRERETVFQTGCWFRGRGGLSLEL